MEGRLLAGALLASLCVAAAACDATPPAAPGSSAPGSSAPASSAFASTPPASPAVLADRPLRLPTVAADARCPVTPRRPWSGPPVAGTVLGDGPVYPVGDYFAEGTVLALREQDRRPDGRYEVKVRWIGAGYTGPVLIRAGRLDGPGAAAVRFLYRGQQEHGGWTDVLTDARSDRPATTTVSGAGCFAYQIDGLTFTTTVVFRAGGG